MDLPFTGWECPQCGWLARDNPDQIRAHRCTRDDDVEIRCRQFIARWNWRKTDPEAAVMRRELDELIAIAKEQP